MKLYSPDSNAIRHGHMTRNPPQYSCPGNPMDRGAWWATVHGVAKESDTTYRLNKKQYVDCGVMYNYVHT